MTIDKTKFKELLLQIATGFGFLIFLVVIMFIAYKLYQLERKTNYDNYYEQMVQKTIKNMVKPECLKNEEKQ